MNKGIEIRNRKKQKNLKKMHELKEEQMGLCRFVSAKNQIIKKVNGKWKHTGSENINGLQIDNRLYVPGGKYKMINSKSIRIISVLDDIPEWATEDLIDRFNNSKKYVNERED